jgi:hypothetical protein
MCRKAAGRRRFIGDKSPASGRTGPARGPATDWNNHLYVGYTDGAVVIYEVNSGQQVGGFGIGVRYTREIAVR